MSVDAKLGTGILPPALEVGRFNAYRQASFVSKAWGKKSQQGLFI